MGSAIFVFGCLLVVALVLNRISYLLRISVCLSFLFVFVLVVFFFSSDCTVVFC
ncbi:uncharacterized protein MELLADRAFT_86976 [Melampsora larici-populina 98AG31]|uniref:Uncharacterized protein n=1 Tax=Melampsora larici-populina (strain 98AG31 / pathotype 3-4-7) TaxID=747676 RepID=F4R424_MELLP|nr:uncharacterized protein MELLADRAFT_86976 [Melampsora larici-populina 98AG31]EGG12727.1 hypothetical protein MELLADRAFT_86976 [Melampsora larici-populina 98AG31]